MADSLLPEELPAFTTVVIGCGDTYLLPRVLFNLSHLTSREKEAVEIITIKLLPKVHYWC